MKPGRQQPVVHRTFQTGAQMGYMRNPAGPGFLCCSRGSAVEAWVTTGPIYTSWVAIADLIDQGTLAP